MARRKRTPCPKVTLAHAQATVTRENWEIVGPVLARMLARAITRSPLSQN